MEHGHFAVRPQVRREHRKIVAIRISSRRHDESFQANFMGGAAEHLCQRFAARLNLRSPIHHQHAFQCDLQPLSDSALPQVEDGLKSNHDGHEGAWHCIFDRNAIVAIVGQCFGHGGFWRQ